MTALSDLMYENDFDAFTQFINSDKCSPELLQAESATNGDNILMQAYYYADARYFEALLKSPHCTKEVLERANHPSGVTILHDAVEDPKGETAKLDLILNHSNFTNECFQKTTSNGATPLYLAMRHNNTEVIRKIIEHPLFSFSEDDDALNYAVSTYGFTEANMALICNSKKINAEHLTVMNTGDKTALDIVIEKNNLVALKALLNNPYCTVDLIKQQGLLEKAKNTENQEIINLVQKHAGRDSYKKIYEDMEGTQLDKACALLKDYTKNESAFRRFTHFHWNRHHVSAVTQLVRSIEDGTIGTIDDLLPMISSIQENLPNQLGSFAMRIEFIKKASAYDKAMYPQNGTELNNVNSL